MKTLAIETSCDDTSLAIVVSDGNFFAVEQMLAYTQTKEHQQRWGVVPEIAARSHAEKILVILDELMLDWDSIDTISVTAYPGLPGALVVGITIAYTLWAIYTKPVIEVNHIMGHVFSVLLERSIDQIQLPYVCLTVSWGHNDLYLIDQGSTYNADPADLSVPTAPKHHHLAVWAQVQVGSYTVTKLGQTLDDAAGECFDKVARMLWGPYPWGKWIGDLVAERQSRIMPDELPVFHAAALPHQLYNFSFSWIKGQIQQYIAARQEHLSDELRKAAIAISFQEEVTSVLTDKLVKAVEISEAQTIGVVGWVSASVWLRDKISSHDVIQGKQLLFPTKFVYCTDNAAMIGVVWLLQVM